MARIRWTDFSGGLWLVGPSDDNPKGTLRRAKGAAPLRTVALRSRSGTLEFYELNAHSMTRYNGRYIIGHSGSLSVSASLNPDTTSTLASIFDGTRLAFVQMQPTLTTTIGATGFADYLFVAGGGELRKVNPEFNSVTEWGIVPPDISSPAAAAVVTQSSNHTDSFNSGAPTGWSESTDTAGNYALQLDTTRKVAGTGSMRFFTIAKNSNAEADKTGISQDWTNIGTGAGSSPLEDYVAFHIRINRPKHIKSISITFDVASAGDPFKGKTFSRELKVQVVRKKKKRELFGTGDILRNKDVQKFLKEKKDLPLDRSMQEFIAEDTIAVVRRRWTRVTIPKATFQANANANPTADWASVRGIRFEVETNRQGTANVNIDELALIGGVGMQGDYQYNVTYLNSTTGTRSNPDLSNRITIKDIERQAVTLSNIPYSSDAQVDKVEIWRTIGNGEVFFKEQEVNNTETTPGSGIIAPVTSNAADYIGMFEGASVTLDPDLELPLDNTKPEDTYEDAVGPHLARMWWTRDSATGKKGRVYYSPVGRAEAVQGFIDPTSEEDAAQKLVIWNQQLWLFTTEHIYRILGFDEPFTFSEVWGAPGTPQPYSVVTAPEGIIYRSTDGVRLLRNGTESVLLREDDPLAAVFRGGTTDGLGPFVGEVGAYGRGEYYISDPTITAGVADRTTLAVDMRTGAWRNIGFPSNFLYYDEKANVLFGGSVPTTIGFVCLARAASASGTLTINSAASYYPFGLGFGAVGVANVAGAQSLMPRDVTVTALYVTQTVALTGDQQITMRINVDGTPDSTLTVTCTAANTPGVVSATGSLAIAQDALVCYEFAFSGTPTPSATISHITAAGTMLPE